jgi:hypothetical protein
LNTIKSVQASRHEEGDDDDADDGKEYRQFVSDGIPTPFSQLRELMNLALAFAEGQVSLPRVFWLDDAGRKMMIDRTRIDLTDIESLITVGLDRAGHHLYHTCGSQGIPSVENN